MESGKFSDEMFIIANFHPRLFIQCGCHFICNLWMSSNSCKINTKQNLLHMDNLDWVGLTTSKMIQSKWLIETKLFYIAANDFGAKESVPCSWVAVLFNSLHAGPNAFTLNTHPGTPALIGGFKKGVLNGSFITVRNEVAKVMFLHLSVILFTGGEYLGRYPPGPGTSPWDQVHPPRPGTLPLGPDTPPRTRYTPLGPGTPPRQTATVVDGTQPTGMHSCFFFNFIGFLNFLEKK